MFSHREEVCRVLGTLTISIYSAHTCLDTFACVHALGKEGMRATEGLLAQTAGGRDRRTEGKEGAAV